jgi:hypothetical protein
MDESLGSFPKEVRNGFLGVDLEQVLENGEEGDFLRTLRDLSQDGVEDFDGT